MSLSGLFGKSRGAISRARKDTEDSCLYASIHIPKTGGITLYNVLCEHFGDGLQTAYGPRAAEGVKIDSKGPPRCIHGHQVMKDWGEHIRKQPQVRWLTFLRDPLLGAISFYYFTRKRLLADPNELLFDDRGLDAWLLNREQHRWPKPPGYAFNRYSKFLRQTGREVGKIDFIGLTDRFDESMFLMYQQFGWKPIHYKASNKGSYDTPEIDPKVLAEFRSINAADYRLYKRAGQSLDEKISDYGSDYECDFNAFCAQLK